jgi:hypothetical protein
MNEWNSALELFVLYCGVLLLSTYSSQENYSILLFLSSTPFYSSNSISHPNQQQNCPNNRNNITTSSGNTHNNNGLQNSKSLPPQLQNNAESIVRHGQPKWLRPLNPIMSRHCERHSLKRVPCNHSFGTHWQAMIPHALPKQRTPMLVAGKQNNTTQVKNSTRLTLLKFLLETGDPMWFLEPDTRSGRSALHMACWLAGTLTVKAILDAANDDDYKKKIPIWTTSATNRAGHVCCTQLWPVCSGV